MSELDELPDGAHKRLAQAIAERVPAAWRVVGVERDLDELEAVTVTCKLNEVRRLDEAPAAGVYWVGWTVTIATPHVDPELSDPAVFDALLELVAALDDIDWLMWTTAQKVTGAGGLYAFDINVDTLTTTPDASAAYAADEPAEPPAGELDTPTESEAG